MKPLHVTQPSLPPLEDYYEYLKKIWETKWIANNGEYVRILENKLSEYLDVPFVSLFNNGTTALQIALKALRITGEVITTPYSFVATTHALKWNGCTPVFADIDPSTCNLNPDKIEASITPHTTAIIPVHVYGYPCDTARIQEIADTYGLPVIYDAAHAFGVRQNNQSILKAGAISMVSFHATKVFNTVEGGMLVMQNSGLKKRVDYLRNFGFENEETVIGIGTNGKMNELIAAYGLLQLEKIDDNIKKRKHLANQYRQLLQKVNGLSFLEELDTVHYNYCYFPIFLNPDTFGASRDSLYDFLKQNNIFGRRYFYPLISNMNAYKGLNSASHKNLPLANMVSKSVICLPLYSDLSKEDVSMVCNTIKQFQNNNLSD